MIPVISFVGYSNSGKTTVLTQVVRELKSRGYRIAVIKHDAHGFDIDVPGKDTAKHAEAGADIVCISSVNKLAYIEARQAEIPLDEVIHRIQDVDVIFTEGYKRENKPKVEVFRSAAGQPPLGLSPDLLATISDTPLYPDVRHFCPEQISLLADFLEVSFLQVNKDMSDNK
jgi:molybdopterin-guanine dinucleotide biosynthesis protein B